VNADELLATLWREYVAVTPQAQRIHDLLGARGEVIHNDHVALRTFGAPGIGLTDLARPFEAAGWRCADDRYRFEDKHLVARYWRHPRPELPKIFISELVLDELPASARAIVDGLVAQLPPGFGARPDLPYAGRPWRVTAAEYGALVAVSEYAAWMAAFGFRVNHFTVSFGALTTFPDLQALTRFLVAEGFELNTAGGVIKGTPAEHLEQASTVADQIDVALADATRRIPSCYYEFARRYPLPGGELFQGFVPASADKIFESTDSR
jgi:hypothetical protein